MNSLAKGAQNRNKIIENTDKMPMLPCMGWVPLFVLLLLAPACAQTYDDLMRYPGRYNLAHVSFSGQIVQVMREKDIDGPYVNLRVQIGHDQFIFVFYRLEPGQDRILEGDAVDLRGWSQGTRTYKAVLGNSIELPFVVACELNAHAPGSAKFVSSASGCRW